MCCEDLIGKERGRPQSCCPLQSPPTRHLSQRHVCALRRQTFSAPQGRLLSPSLPLLSLFSSPHCLHSFPLLFLLPSILSVIPLCTFSPSGGYKGRSCWRERAGHTWAPENYCSGWERQGCRGATSVWILEQNRGRRRSRSTERQPRDTHKACFQGTDHAGLSGGAAAAAVPGGAPRGKWCQKNQEKRAQSQGEAAHFEDGECLQFIGRLVSEQSAWKDLKQRRLCQPELLSHHQGTFVAEVRGDWTDFTIIIQIKKQFLKGKGALVILETSLFQRSITKKAYSKICIQCLTNFTK